MFQLVIYILNCFSHLLLSFISWFWFLLPLFIPSLLRDASLVKPSPRATYDDLIASLPVGTSPKRIPRLVQRAAAGEISLCPVCRLFRADPHACHNLRPSPSYDAWVGDALLSLQVRLRLGKVDALSFSRICSNASMAAYVRDHYPEFNVASVGVFPSDHSLATLLEALFVSQPSSLDSYLSFHLESH